MRNLALLQVQKVLLYTFMGSQKAKTLIDHKYCVKYSSTTDEH